MPTGYTQKLCEGEQTFRDFLFTCARGMGACIALRDDALNENLPDDVGFSSDYHAKALLKAKDEVVRLSAMSEEERIVFGKNTIKRELKKAQSRLDETKATRDRLAAMTVQATEWTPPTKDHEGVKRFMLEQLKSTLDFDGDSRYAEREVAILKAKEPIRVWQEALASAKGNVAYNEEEQSKETKQNEARNEWVKLLKSSIA